MLTVLIIVGLVGLGVLVYKYHLSHSKAQAEAAVAEVKTEVTTAVDNAKVDVTAAVADVTKDVAGKL